MNEFDEHIFMKIHFLNTKKFTPALLLFLFLTVLALLNFTRFVTSRLAEGEPPHYKFYFIMETTGAYTILIVLPFVLWFIKKYPIKKENMITRIPMHIFASMIYGVSHSMLMFSSRTLIFWIAGWGSYDYGKFIYKIPMEYTHQFFSYFLIYGIVMFNNYLKDRQAQKLRTSQLEEQLTKARLQALQMQLHPHFLFNTLNMISATMYDDAKTADKMIANLSDLLRITLNSKGAEEIPLEKELEIINVYFEIMKARFQDKLSIKMNIEDESLEALVPAFMFQPLVENSIKYSMEKIDLTEILISSQKEDDKLKLIIEDNGPGISGEIHLAYKNGVGLSNTAERLQKLYGENHLFQVQNRGEGGLKVAIELPFKTSDQKKDN